MRISDWSSDVCSSDLEREQRSGAEHQPRLAGSPPGRPGGGAGRRRRAHCGGAVDQDRYVAESADPALDRVPRGAVHVEGERQAAEAEVDADVAPPRQTLEAVLDLECTGPAVHAFDTQTQRLACQLGADPTSNGSRKSTRLNS